MRIFVEIGIFFRTFCLNQYGENYLHIIYFLHFFGKRLFMELFAKIFRFNVSKFLSFDYIEVRYSYLMEAQCCWAQLNFDRWSQLIGSVCPPPFIDSVGRVAQSARASISIKFSQLAWDLTLNASKNWSHLRWLAVLFSTLNLHNVEML